MGFFRRNKTVDLVMINDESGEAFASSQVPADSLPETFALETTLHIADAPWHVVSASPPSRREAERLGRLELRLRRLHMVNPHDLLFSLPSICDALPTASEEPRGSSECVLIREDDWRQLEFVSRAFADEIAHELNAIRSIMVNSRQGAGFTEIHLRQAIPRPLSAAIPLEEITQITGDAPVTPLRFDGSPLAISGGFSARVTDELFAYGVAGPSSSAPGLSASVLALLRYRPQAVAATCLEAIRALATRHDLVLVDWCCAEQHEVNSDAFEAVLGR